MSEGFRREAGQGSVESLAQAAIRKLRAYDPGHDLVALRRQFDDLIELGANENPYGASHLALAAARAAIEDVHRYPDPLGGDLKQALAETFGLTAEQIALGNGSHELLMLLGQIFTGPDAALACARHSFAVYALSAMATGASIRWADAHPRDHAMPCGHDLDALLSVIDASTRLVCLANPNNPTGTWLTREELRAFLSKVPDHVVVVVDEAYREYQDDPEAASALALMAEFPRLAITGTFSKAHGLAGLRVGYLLAQPAVIDLIERLRESFNVNSVALAAAQAALADTAHVDRVREGNAREREVLVTGLRERGLFVFPSRTNFLLVEFGPHCAALEQRLVDCGVVLRPMVGYGLGDCLRITVGTADENRLLLETLDVLMPKVTAPS
ncbi:MAG: histidinol-phosphate transaminase [Lysobacteraceae bacterium]